MRKAQIVITACVMIAFALCGCGKSQETTEKQEAGSSSVAAITVDHNAELQTYTSEALLEGESLRWILSATEAATETEQLVLGEDCQITARTPLSVPADFGDITGYAVNGDESCLLSSEKVSIYKENEQKYEEEGSWLGAAAFQNGFLLLELAIEGESSANWNIVSVQNGAAETLGQLQGMGDYGNICCDENGDIYISTDYGIAQYHAANSTCTYILAWESCGIYPYDVTDIAKTENGFFVIAAGNLYSLSPGSGQKEEEPVKLHIGTLASGSSSISQLVSYYNSAQSQYCLEAKEYASVAELNMGVLAGDVDVIHIYNIPESSYIAKGVLADLSSWMEQDAEIDDANYFSTVWDASSTAGKRYSAISSFTLNGLMMPETLVGEQESWTLSDFQNVIGNSNALKKNTKQTMLAITFDAGRYIDAETNIANFDGQEFIDYLNYLNQFLNTSSELSADGTASDLTNTEIFSVLDVQQENYSAMFWNGAPVRFMGFPSEDGSGMTISTVDALEIGMVSNGNQEGAWSVIRYALSKEFAEKASGMGLTARKDVMQQQIEDAIASTAQTDSPYSQEDGTRLLDLINQASGKQLWDTTIEDIVNEETAAFFAGDKTAADTAAVIQNRVSIYLSEQG